MPELEAPLEVGGLELPNRLYRAPLLECAGDGPDAPETLASELEPAAAAGAGLVFQGAAPVREEGGRVAPSMTPLADPEFARTLSALTDAIHDHGGRIFAQLDHGGLRTMETWHAEYRRANPELSQLAVSEPPWPLRLADRLGFLALDARVLSTEEVYELAADVGRCAANADDAGYDGVHLAGANMGIFQQFLSPFYNRRDDEFADGVRFLEVVHDEIRARAGDVALVAKVPAETASPPFVRRHLTDDDAVEICARLDRIGYDALVPVRCSTFWDMSIVRGRFPDRAWRDEQFREGYVAAFGSRWKAALVAAANRVEAVAYDFEPGWNADLARRVRERTSVPVLLEGGIRSREQIDDLLGSDGSEQVCDAVGMGRPFYAEPRLPARLLDSANDAAEAVCDNCNNCTVPQVTGANGVCRTPEVLAERGELEREGTYERD
ncbi:NADH:flavin oxidoreductase [Halorussus sp. MSC15.2]|uniref:oxidoreductase n=1 Tax=Halorussus sp. MSC15.2 TaxID=2283638 RepID=UPI0013D46C37|nr:NADH:flavin oxidoreductase [Halorussus sp. MSC15.2]NEU58016.1 NADH:flavin oxidoreductase [Halorussus sp. MSC15.2]